MCKRTLLRAQAALRAALADTHPASMACTSTESVRAAPKRFQLIRPPVQAKAARVSPKAADLKLDDGRLPPPPTKTLSHFKRPCGMWLALDIETHELIPNTALYQGWVPVAAAEMMLRCGKST